jgi:hypothetical protein
MVGRHEKDITHGIEISVEVQPERVQPWLNMRILLDVQQFVSQVGV